MSENKMSTILEDTIHSVIDLPSELVGVIIEYCGFYADDFNKGELYRAITMSLNKKGKMLKRAVSSWSKPRLVQYLKSQPYHVIEELRLIQADKKWSKFTREQIIDAFTKAYEEKSLGRSFCFSRFYYSIHRKQPKAMLVHEVTKFQAAWDLDVDKHLS